MEQGDKNMTDASKVKMEPSEEIMKSDNLSREQQEEKKNSVAAADTEDEATANVDPVLFDNLIKMGMDRRLTAKALVCTGNKSVDAALSWIAELGADEMEALCGSSDHGSLESEEWEDCEEEDDDDETYYKMVFVVNTELGMGVGKVAAQVSFGSVHTCSTYNDLVKYGRPVICDRVTFLDKLSQVKHVPLKVRNGKTVKKRMMTTRHITRWFLLSIQNLAWELVKWQHRERKIALRGKNSQELVELQKKAEALYLPTYLVQDAGKTQVPVGSTTVLAIFGDEEAVNEVTGKLKLL
ncbi:probable peptidyl-tRNA hydrolase 2 [Panulirus ornatus]|uniref:probable peptidyl-tRNA hydrolase 2 n=1 Tax=Panulirus ornatus TaxID=150431 RepID=UPI003A85CE11